MANNLDIAFEAAQEILQRQKTAPEIEFDVKPHGGLSFFSAEVGLLQEGTFMRGLSVELCCRVTQKPNRQCYKFTVFQTEFQIKKRVYQLDVMTPPICAEADHNWPHEHIGKTRVSFGDSFPRTFDECIAYFCKKTNITFESPPRNPLEFCLK